MVGKARRLRGGGEGGGIRGGGAACAVAAARAAGSGAGGRAAAYGGLRGCPRPVRPEGWARFLCPAPFTSGCDEEQVRVKASENRARPVGAGKPRSLVSSSRRVLAPPAWPGPGAFARNAERAEGSNESQGSRDPRAVLSLSRGQQASG